MGCCIYSVTLDITRSYSYMPPIGYRHYHTATGGHQGEIEPVTSDLVRGIGTNEPSLEVILMLEGTPLIDFRDV